MTFVDFLAAAGEGIVRALPHLAVLLVLLWGYKLLHDWITPYDDRALLSKGNIAVAITRAGAYLGVAIAVIGSLIGGDDERSYWASVGIFAVDGVIAAVVMTVAVLLFDRVIVRNVRNAGRIADGNKAVGFMEACVYISMGLITGASFSGGGQPFWTGVGSAVLFSLIGMVTLVVIYVSYGWAWIRFKQCDVDDQIGKGNLAAAIDAGSLLIAMSLTLWFSISGDFTGWGSDLIAYLLAVLSSTIIVPLGRVAVSKLLVTGLPGTMSQGHHQSIPRSLIIGFVSIAIGLAVGLIQFTM